MTLGERIAHVGGRITEDGTVEFGSVMALDALVQHVLRDTRAAASPAAEAVAYVCSASNDFAPIVRNKDSAQRLSDAHGDGKIVPLYAAPQPAHADAPAEARERDDPELIAASNKGYAAGLRDGKALGACGPLAPPMRERRA